MRPTIPAFRRRLTAVTVALASAAVAATLTSQVDTSNSEEAVTSVSRNQAQAAGGAPKSIILMIGDGMGEAHVHSTQLHYAGRDGRLAMQRMPVFTQMSSYSADNVVTDSAAASTALASGVLTENGVIGRDSDGEDVLDESILMRAKATGKATGLVTEVPIGHATPAGFAASVPNRNDLPEISRQFLAHGVDVLLGGGEQDFLGADQSGEHCEIGRRTDGRNLVREATRAGYTHVSDARELNRLQQPRRGSTAPQVLGLFACENMGYSTAPIQGEPTTAAKTSKALNLLSADRDGFFVMIERAKIDWTAEANDLPGTLQETKDFDDAVAVARNYVRNNPDTLLVVTADHEAGGMTIVGGPSDRRGPGVATDQTTTVDGLPMYVRWGTQPGHTAAPVGVRVEGRGSRWFQRSWNGDEHLVDLQRDLVSLAGLD